MWRGMHRKNQNNGGTRGPPPDRHRRLSSFCPLLMAMMGLLIAPVFAQDEFDDNNSTTSSIADSRIPVPTNVNIEMVNETTALLTWDNNTTNDDDVIGYNISVKCDTRPMDCCGPCEVNETTEDTELTFSVEGATTYYAMVASRTNQSTGTWSTEVTLRTNSTVPNKPNIEECPDKKSFTFNLTYGCPYTGPAEYVFGIEGRKQRTAKLLGQDRCSYEFTVEELVPFTEYKYSLLAVNEGCRDTSCQGITYPLQEDSKTTQEDVSTSYYGKKSTTEAYTEDSSSIIDGVETESNITITSNEVSETTIFNSTTTDAPDTSTSTEESSSEGSLTTDFVKPHEICSACSEGSVKTSPDLPGEPEITDVQKPNYKGKHLGYMILKWMKPNVTNGNVESYRLDITVGDNTTKCEIEHKTSGKECHYKLTGDYGSCNIPLRINTTYYMELRARNEGMQEYGPPAVRQITTGSGWPYLDGIPYNKLSSSDLENYPLYKSYPIQIRKEKFEEQNGQITKCQILLAEGNNDNRGRGRYFDTSKKKSPFQGWIVYSESTLPDRFLFGSDESPCQHGETCNAYLDPSKTYQFLFRVFSGSKYTESMTYSFTTKANVTANVLTGVSVVFFLLLALSIAGLFVYKRYFSPIVKKGESMELPLLVPSVLDESQSKPILLSVLPETVNRLMAEDQRILKSEYLELRAASPSKPTETAKDGFNVSKNRYINILPFDETRVILNEYRNIPNSDYINASYVHGYDKPKEFIACQGPRENEKDDFWRMVWEKNVHVIVMVTKCVEAKTAKCCKYWPDYSESKAMHLPLSNLSVKTREETPHTSDGYVYRIIQLTKHHSLFRTSRTIKQFHYTVWPDMGCPVNPDHLIQFTTMIKKAIPEKSAHTVVHCSAGVGRTGTYIALNNLMEEMKTKDSVDIYQTVYRMRQNRVNMVQTVAQYAFIYKCAQRYAEIQRGVNSTPSNVEINMPNDIPDVVTTTFSALNSLDEEDAIYKQDMPSEKSEVPSSLADQIAIQDELDPMTDDDYEQSIFEGQEGTGSGNYSLEDLQEAINMEDKNTTENNTNKESSESKVKESNEP